MRKFITYCIIISIFAGSVFVLTKNCVELFTLYGESLRQYGIFPAISGAFYLVLLRNRFRFWENFLHEFTHLVFAILLMDKIRQFYVSETSGELVLNSGHKNLLISLSPYFFPLIPLVAILVLNNSYQFNTVFVACTFGFYLGRNVWQIISYKKEITEFPFVGIPLIILMNFWMGLLILSWCAGKSKLIIELLK
jgi:hypothetical protein